ALVECGGNLAHPRLRLPRLSRIIVQISEVVARLVSLAVHPNQTSESNRVVGQGIVGVEEFIELRDKFLLAAQGANQAGNIMRNKKVILPGIGLGIVRKVHACWIKWHHPGSVWIAAPHE